MCCASHSLCSSTSSLKEQTPSETITLLNCGFGEGKRTKPQPSPDTINILPLQGKISVLLQLLRREWPTLSKAHPDKRYHTSHQLRTASTQPQLGLTGAPQSCLAERTNAAHGVLGLAQLCCKPDRHRGLQLNWKPLKSWQGSSKDWGMEKLGLCPSKEGRGILSHLDSALLEFC